MTWHRLHVCSFADGLDRMKREQQKDPIEVLKVLDRVGRFSVFEATATATIARVMTKLVNDELILVDNSNGFPWSKVIVTEKGRKYAGL